MNENEASRQIYFEYALLGGGLLLFAAILILAFSLKNENLHEKNRAITWYRKTDLAVSALVTTLKFAEKLVPERLEKGGSRLTYTEASLTATGILPLRDPRIQLTVEGRDLVRRELTNGRERNRTILFQEVESFEVLIEEGLLRLDLAIVSPEEKRPLLFSRTAALDHNP